MTKAVATSAVQKDFGECMNVRASRVSDAAAKFAVWCRGDVRLISAPNARDRRSKVQWPKSKVFVARQTLDFGHGPWTRSVEREPYKFARMNSVIMVRM